MFSWIHLQIAVEAVFLIAIVFMLWRLSRHIDKYRPLADGSVLAELKQITTDSQASADGFLSLLEENKQTLGRLSRQLDEKERRLVILNEQAEATLKKLHDERVKLEGVFSAKRYDDVGDMARQGATREELAKKSGLTEDELSLVMAFARAKTEPSP